MKFNFKKIKEDVETIWLLNALNAQPDLWEMERARQDYPGSPHTDTRCIFIRWAADKSPEAVFRDIEAVDYPALKRLPEVTEILFSLSEILNWSSIGRVIITELKPGGIILPHIDEGAYADHYERFHVPISSGLGNHFFVSEREQHGEFVHMQPDELWCFNHKRNHWFHNGSSTPRVHLIVDAVCPEYRSERDI